MIAGLVAAGAVVVLLVAIFVFLMKRAGVEEVDESLDPSGEDA